jgi:hypothetical protein
MKIVSLVKSQSSSNQMTFETEPELTDEVSTALGRLRNKSELLKLFELKNEKGLLVVFSAAGTKPMSFPPDFQKALSLALDEAEQGVERGRRNKEEQEKKAQQERETAILDAAKAFGVPIVEAVETPIRKLTFDDK